VPNAEEAIARQRPGFRKCYNRTLAVDPCEAGCVTFVLQIARDGAVTSVESHDVDGLSAATMLCLESLLREVRFDPPVPKGAKLAVPIKFMPSSEVRRGDVADAGARDTTL
jgi:hypothetical protein